MRTTLLLGLITLAGVALNAAAEEKTNSGYLIHDMERAPAPAVTPGTNGGPPADAIVLFDGANLNEWRTEDGAAPAWLVQDGYLQCVEGADDIFTKRNFGDCQLHIEWASPADPAGKIDQDRGNSGIFFMEKYEIQVLDSYQSRTYSDGYAGSVYAQYPPQVNATRPPGEWQTYDIVFHRPRFKKDGSLRKPARITAFLNGILVQDNVTLTGPTGWLQQKPYEAHADEMSLKLQDHDSPVRFRNIWIRPLATPDHLKKIKMKSREAKVQLTAAQLDRFVGAYETIDPDEEKKEVPFIVIRREGDQLYATVRDKQERRIFAQTENEFVFEIFDGTLTIESDAQGNVTGVNFRVGLNPKFEKKL
jgi:hypothetical protein